MLRKSLSIFLFAFFMHSQAESETRKGATICNVDYDKLFTSQILDIDGKHLEFTGHVPIGPKQCFTFEHDFGDYYLSVLGIYNSGDVYYPDLIPCRTTFKHDLEFVSQVNKLYCVPKPNEKTEYPNTNYLYEIIDRTDTDTCSELLVNYTISFNSIKISSDLNFCAKTQH